MFLAESTPLPRTHSPRDGEDYGFIRLALDSFEWLLASSELVACHQDHYNLVVAIDWHNAERLAAELPMD